MNVKQQIESVVESWLRAPKLVFILLIPVMFPVFLLCILVPAFQILFIGLFYTVIGFFSKRPEVQEMSREELEQWCDRLFSEYAELCESHPGVKEILVPICSRVEQLAALLNNDACKKTELCEVARQIQAEFADSRHPPNSELLWLCAHVEKWAS